jgi:uncharacterized alpha/beta hydrolase family protein
MEKLRISVLTFLLSLSLISFLFAEIINYDKPLDKRWNDDRAYRPAPVLFLHGFGAGET